VLNSCLLHAPEQVSERLAEQRRWLQHELAQARKEGARHIAVFQHHPWFLQSVDEKDNYTNLPAKIRAEYFALFREHGVKHVFCGHYHRNAIAHHEGVEVVTTGPVGKPLGRGDQSRSGLRVVIVRESGLEHEYYDFGRLPNKITLESPTAPSGTSR